jgi:hypothetical protein
MTEKVSRPPRIEFAGAVNHVLARAEIDRKRFSEMIEIGQSFWAIPLKAQSAPG